jgi:TetR/AcrR family transcriptional regulator, repressor for uid operon
MSALAEALSTERLAEDPVRERILEAALEQFKLIGLRRTTVGDVARRAGVGRVTVYRRVGHKRELVVGVIQAEVSRLMESIREAIAPFESAEDRLVEAFVVGAEVVRSHPLLQRLLETEPEDLLPYLTLDFAPILEVARTFVTTEVAPGRDAGLLGEVLARLAQSLVLTPGGIAAGDEQALREFARHYVAPFV